MAAAFVAPPALDYLAIFAWALSGALVALRKNLDFVGVFLTAMASSIGGGLIRDGLLLQKTPPVLTNAAYLPLIALATIAAILFARRLLTGGVTSRAIDIVDSVGTPAFAVLGVDGGLAAGLPWPGVLLVGCVSGVGGAVLRDVLVREIPEIMKPGRYQAILVALICAVYLALIEGLGARHALIAWGVVGFYMVLRYVTTRYDWRTRPVWKEPESKP